MTRRPIALFAMVALFATFAVSASAQTYAWRSQGDEGDVVVSVDETSVWEVHTDAGWLFAAPTRGYLGIDVIELSPELRAVYGVSPQIGVMVSRVADESPAATAGIGVGDIVMAIGDHPVDSDVGLKRALGQLSAGDAVLVEIWRRGESIDFEVAVAERETRVVELRQFFRRGDDGRVFVVPPGPEYQVGPEAGVVWRNEPLDLAFEEALRALEDPELRAMIEAEIAKRDELEQRLEAMEQRLHELEAERQSPDDRR